MINVSYLTITRIIIDNINSKLLHNLPEWSLLTIKDCSFVILHHLQIYLLSTSSNDKLALVIVNIMGNSNFSHVTCYDRIQLFYNEMHTETEHHVLAMTNLKPTSSLKIKMIQNSYRVTLKIIGMLLQNTRNKLNSGIYDSFIQAELGANKIILINCYFIENVYENHLFSFSSLSTGSVHFINCQFINNYNTFNMVHRTLHNMMQIGLRQYVKHTIMKVYFSIRIEFKNCYFHADIEFEAQVLQTYGNSTYPAKVTITSTTFSYESETNPFEFWYNTTILDMSFISLSHTTLILEDSVIFRNITTPNSIISVGGNSTIVISGLVEFLGNHAHDLINFYANIIKYVILKEDTIINIANNNVWSHFATKPTTARYPYPFCLFQYFSNKANNTHVPMIRKRNFAISFYNNQCKQNLRLGCYDHIPVTHCLWLPHSLFNNTIPLEVNSKYIQFINNSGTYKLSQIIEQSSLCVCTNELHHDCHTNDLG